MIARRECGRCGAVRCGAGRCGPVRAGAVRAGAGCGARRARRWKSRGPQLSRRTVVAARQLKRPSAKTSRDAWWRRSSSSGARQLEPCRWLPPRAPSAPPRASATNRLLSPGGGSSTLSLSPPSLPPSAKPSAPPLPPLSARPSLALSGAAAAPNVSWLRRYMCRTTRRASSGLPAACRNRGDSGAAAKTALSPSSAVATSRSSDLGVERLRKMPRLQPRLVPVP